MPKPVPATDFLKAPDKLGKAPVYAVFGAEDYLRRKCLKVLLGVLEQRGLEIRRVHVDDNIARLLDDLRSPSLFGGNFAAVVLNQRQGARHEVTTRFKDELASYLENPGKRNVMVFDGATFQRNLTVPKRVSAEFPTVICEALKPWDQRSWHRIAAEQALELGMKADDRAITALREYVGGSLARAESELMKLALMVDDGKLTADHIALACGYEGADMTFPLCDAILAGDTRNALSHAAKMAGKAEMGRLLSLLALLRLQVVALGRAAIALRQGASAGDAITRAKVRLRDNHKAGFVRTARGLDRRDIAQASNVLLSADESMKTSSPDPANLLVSVVARLCEVLHKRETERAVVR
ncbi:MAG: DNA polymerase III subunit delta [Planctomycetes bacterium]|nr:DNA polymerase III subunit delta [Planctomycetota bacterium]